MTPSLRLDHILTFTDTPIGAQLESYRRAGFLLHDRTARWDPGLHNGFVRFWPEYLEFLQVEDAAAFEEGAATYHSLGGAHALEVRRSGRPYGIGFYSDDVAALHEAWRARGVALPAPAYWHLKDTPPDAPPDFAYQELPLSLLPGTACFALTSFAPNPPLRREGWVSPNSAFAISGATFVCEQPEARALAWRDVLAPDADIAPGRSQFLLAPHRLAWLTPDAYETRFGTPWRHAPHPCGELAAVHLLAEDLRLFGTSLVQAGWRAKPLDDGTLHVVAERGVSFLVHERSAASWFAERRALTGERLELHRATSS